MNPNRMSRRYFLASCAAVATGLAAAACAPKIVKETVIKEVEVIVKETVVAEVAGPGVTEITYNGIRMADKHQRLILEFAENFENRHPEYRIKHIWATWDEHNRMVPVWAAAGELADIIYVHGARAFPWNHEGITINLNPYVELDEEFNIDGMWEEAVKLYRYKGELREIPKDHGPRILGYNKDLFDEFGVEYPTEDWTIDDLLITAKKLTDPAKKRWGMNANVSMNPDGVGGWLGPWGDQSINDEETKVLLDSDANKAALQFWADMIHLHKCSPAPAESKAFPGGVWRAGVVAMYHLPPWDALSTYEAGINYDVAPWPPKVRRRCGSFGAGFAISKDCTIPDDAWNFLRERFSKEGLDAVDAQVGCPPRKANYQTWFDSEETAEHAIYFMEAMETYAVTDHPHHTLGAEECLSILNREKSLIMTGDKTVEEAVAVMVEEGTAVLEEADKRLKEAGYYH